MSRKHFLLFIFLLLLPAPLFAADLVNINTADSTTLQTLSGIGPSKAQAIIDYRTEHGAFAAIEDIMNVSGIGTATFNTIKDSITVSAVAQSQPQTQTSTPTQIQTQVISGGSSPPQVTARITADTQALVGAGTIFEGAAFGTQGEPLTGARFIWNFGDGVTAEGVRVLHTYAYPSTYDVQLSVGYNYSSATARLALPAVPVSVSLVAEGDGSLTVGNTTANDLDIGLWSLVQGSNPPFVIPEKTVVLQGMGIRFSPNVLRFAGDTSAILRYPNGAFAAGAIVGQHSPLRGEQVSMSAAKRASADTTAAVAVKTSAQKAAPSASAGQAAAVAASPASREVAWSYLVGLAAVIALGAVGAYYAHRPRRAFETDALAEEFNIE